MQHIAASEKSESGSVSNNERTIVRTNPPEVNKIVRGTESSVSVPVNSPRIESEVVMNKWWIQKINRVLAVWKFLKEEFLTREALRIVLESLLIVFLTLDVNVLMGVIVGQELSVGDGSLYQYLFNWKMNLTGFSAAFIVVLIYKTYDLKLDERQDLLQEFLKWWCTVLLLVVNTIMYHQAINLDSRFWQVLLEVNWDYRIFLVAGIGARIANEFALFFLKNLKNEWGLLRLGILIVTTFFLLNTNVLMDTILGSPSPIIKDKDGNVIMVLNQVEWAFYTLWEGIKEMINMQAWLIGITGSIFFVIINTFVNQQLRQETN